MKSMRLYFACTLLLTLTACGGGGGGSNGGNNTTNPPPPGGGGGGGGGGGTVSNGGLLSGGVGVVVDTNTSGVALDVAVGGTGMVAGDIQDFGSEASVTVKALIRRRIEDLHRIEFFEAWSFVSMLRKIARNAVTLTTHHNTGPVPL